MKTDVDCRRRWTGLEVMVEAEFSNQGEVEVERHSTALVSVKRHKPAADRSKHC